ncbi:MAG: endonuclease/exonuclease/phosphatase family protein [Clostridia bacterium]|nr:endonuclease/exonuclease/phosphatase family protein [Clostridia bacterium]
MKVMSFNILCYGRDENSLLSRMGLVVRAIRNEEPELFGVQEAHYTWMKVLIASFPDYAYAGVGRDDGKKNGEFSAVFYKKDLFRKLDAGSFWLSETPDKPGIKGWDAACVRVCSWAKLKEKKTGKEFIFMNTHLDHIGEIAMQKGAELIASKAKEIGGSLPAILTGDFNVTPDSAPCKAVKDGGFTDTRDAAKKTDMSNTFHNFDSGSEGQCVIDYVFVKGVKAVKSFKVIKKKIDGRFPSDHWPVVADIAL